MIQRDLPALAVGSGVAIIMALLIMFATAALSELTARQKFLVGVEARLTELRTELGELSATRPPDTMRVASLRNDIDHYRSVRSDAHALIAAGESFSGFHIRSLQRELSNGDKWLAGDQDTQLTPFTDYWLGSLRGMSSDTLLVLLLTICGAIGSGIAGVRSKDPLTMKQLALGGTAGFVAFLALNGGEQIFLIQPANTVTTFNPYSSAFFALVAGLFTERAYELLSTLVDHFSDKLKQVVTS